MLSLENVPWLKGHEVDGKIVLPGAAYIAMIGEALRQLDSEGTFSLRNVRLTAARVIQFGQTTELHTSLKPVEIENSPWYTFTISSFDGTRWISNCSGEARASSDDLVSLASAAPSRHSFPRKVDEASWFGTMKLIGLNLTGAFRGMKSISAATMANEAPATVPSPDELLRRESYALHPSSIDKCFQVLFIAAGCGLGRNMNTLSIPTFIEEIVVSRSMTDLHVVGEVGTLVNGCLTGNLTVHDGGQQVLYLKGFKSSTVTADAGAATQPIITQFQWSPSSDFVNLGDCMHPRQEIPSPWPLLEELITLCVIDHQKRIKLDDAVPPYLSLFANWMQLHTDKYISGANVFVSNGLHLQEFRGESRLARIEEIVGDLSTSSWSPYSTAIYRLFKEAPDIFAGEVNPLGILLEGGLLTRLYNASDALEFSRALYLIRNKNPRLRVLEVGSGTGGTTAKVL
ncbi:Uu.00g042500.m01.CDS01 [Anthostomella pinea]|uniref:Uu.00g042500.m01.CDS01 n=1 Tax=Anthostomella pinea TaxID=933095 RepID=A0AAI8VB41_9PEZI|nr:Uu.00g042500.m01.CDS01 [Anthostomella pinea]